MKLNKAPTSSSKKQNPVNQSRLSNNNSYTDGNISFGYIGNNIDIDSIQREQFLEFLMPSRSGQTKVASTKNKNLQYQNEKLSKLVSPMNNTNHPIARPKTTKSQRKTFPFGRGTTIDHEQKLRVKPSLASRGLQGHDSVTLATTSLGSPSLGINNSLLHYQTLMMNQPSHQTGIVMLKNQKRTKSSQGYQTSNISANKRRAVLSSAVQRKPLQVATSSPYIMKHRPKIQGSNFIKEDSVQQQFDVGHMRQGFYSGAAVMSDTQINIHNWEGQDDDTQKWLDDSITPQNLHQRGKRPHSSAAATGAYANVKKRLRNLSSHNSHQSKGFIYPSGNHQHNILDNPDLLSAPSPRSQTTNKGAQYFNPPQLNTPLAMAQRQLDSTLECLDYSIMQGVKVDLQPRKNIRSLHLRVKGLDYALKNGMRLVDETEQGGHFDVSGLDVRRRKIANECNVVRRIKQMSAQQLLQQLMKFAKLARKASKNQKFWTINEYFANHKEQSKDYSNEVNFAGDISQKDVQILYEQENTFNISSTIEKEILVKSNKYPLTNDVRDELDEYIENQNKNLLMKISQNKVQQQVRDMNLKISSIEGSISQLDQQIMGLKYGTLSGKKQGDNHSILKRKTLILISKLKKHVYDDLECQIYEKDPFQGPFKSTLREGFYKPVSKSREGSQSPNASIRRSQIKEIVNLSQQDTLNDQNPHQEGQQADPVDPISVLQEKVKKLETLLRERTDNVISTGERMQLVIDYRKYEATKIDQFQEIIQKVKMGVVNSSQNEVDHLIHERKRLQLEAFRLSKYMQHKIDENVKNEANKLILSEQSIMQRQSKFEDNKSTMQKCQ